MYREIPVKVISGLMRRKKLANFLFPVIFAMPVFDLVGAVFGTSLAASWAWW